MKRELLILMSAGLLVGCEGAHTITAERSDYQTPRDPETEYEEPSGPDELETEYLQIIAASFNGKVGFVTFDATNAYVDGQVSSDWSYFYVETYDPEWVMVSGDVQGSLLGLPLEVMSGAYGIGCSRLDELPLDGVVVTSISDSPVVEGATDMTLQTELLWEGEPQLVDLTLTLR